MDSGLLLVFVFVYCTSAQQKDFPALKGPYLGQKPPGMTPEVFVPHLLSRAKPDWAFCACFHPDKRFFYFVSDGPGDLEHIECLSNIEGVWTEPERIGLNIGHPVNNFCFSPNGETMFFRSWRPLPGQDKADGRSSLWYSRQGEEGWRAARPVRCGGAYVRSVGQPSVSEDGTLYFATRLEDTMGSSDIYRSRLVEGVYGTPENLGSDINTVYGEADLCVSLDAGFIVVTCWNRPDNDGPSDLYVGFRKEDGTWSALINMGDTVNTEHNESAPTLSSDGKYLFFVRVDVSGEVSKCATYWVDAGIIDAIRANHLE